MFGGYALAGYIRSGEWAFVPSGIKSGEGSRPGETGKDGSGQASKQNTEQNGKSDGSDGSRGENTGRQDSTVVLNKTPVELIYDFNTETGRIENLLIGILRTLDGRIDYIRIDTDIVYTMSANLYTMLTPDNTTLPQMITLSELYRYYHNDKAFDAGRQIVSEMLNFNIQYYSAMPDTEFARLFRIRRSDGETLISYALDPDDARNGYGTQGSVKGCIESLMEDCITNWDTDQRLRYLDCLELLDGSCVSFANAPVIEMNESTRLDSDAAGQMLYEILYQ